MRPIPEDAQPDDPCWALAYLELAHGMVIAGTKPKLIQRYSHLSHRRISELYKFLRGTTPPTGSLMYGRPGNLAHPNRVPTDAWRIQCAIFLECYERMGQISKTPLQRGWRLLAAFRSYASITQKLIQTTTIRRLDINQAYILLTYCKFLTGSTAEVQRRRCRSCFMNYPVVMSNTPELQPCPACTQNAKLQRVSNNTPPTPDFHRPRI